MKTSLSSTSLRVSAAAALLIAAQIGIVSSTINAVDPGVRPGTAGAGASLDGLSANQLEYFSAGQADFAESERVADGLGPRMNLDSCGGCHAQPSVGGTSPAINPEMGFRNLDGGTDAPPPFISANGPVREARFVSNHDGTADGGVHALFTIGG